MTLIISLSLGLLALSLLIPALVLAIECLSAVARPHAAERGALGANHAPLKAVIVPAHNEAATIDQTLASLQTELAPGDQLLVVADNCSDETATVATGLGAEVLVRDDPARRGKGYALDFALNHLRAKPPEVVVFMDADCVPAPGSLRLITRLAAATGRPAQAHYRMAVTDEGTGRRIAGFAWLVRGLVRPTGLAALGMPCQLYGTGMALPWGLAERLALASGNIVEDMKLTLDLIDLGTLPLFCADASVQSAFPTSEQAATDQRRRWEHGHIATILGHGLPALGRSLLKGDISRIALALDVCVLPLSLFLLLLMAATLLALGAVVLLGTGQVALAILALAWGLTLSGLTLAWYRFGRQILPARTLLGIPRYVLAKRSLYLKFFTQRQKEWNRAGRG